MVTEKAFIGYDNRVSAHKHMLYLIDKGVVPMILVERLDNSRTYKKCDKWLLAHGFRRELVEVETPDVFGLAVIFGSQDRYEYYRINEVKNE